MTRLLLLVLFLGTLGGQALGLDFGLGPGLSIKNALLYTTFTVIAVDCVIARNRKVELMSVLLPYALLVFYAGMSWLLIVIFLENPYYEPLVALIRLKSKLIDQFLMLLVFFYGVVKWEDALWLMKALICAIAVGCLVTVLDTFDIPDLGIVTVRDQDGRVEGIVGSAQDFGAICAFYLPAALALWWTTSGAKKVFSLIGAALILISLLLSASRGAMLGLLVGSLLAGFLMREQLTARLVSRAVIAFFVVAAGATVVVLSTEYGALLESRLSTGLSSGDLESISSGRSAIWTAAIKEMADTPLSFITGLGWESYYATLGSRYATHSVYLDTLYNLGAIGLVLLLLSLAGVVFIMRRQVATASEPVAPFLKATLLGMIAFAISMAFSNIENAGIFIWAFSGLALRAALAATDSSTAHPNSYSRVRSGIRDKIMPTTRATSGTPNRWAQ